MKILVIDNGSRELPQLLERLPKNDTFVMKRGAISKQKLPKFDLLILSGGHSRSVANHKEFYKAELRLIRRTKRPVLGICLGFELIAQAFGGKLEKLNHKEKGRIEIKTNSKTGILKNIPQKFYAYEAHRWYLSETPKKLVALADSSCGIEIIKHKTKPIYGVQFHPESFKKKVTGYKILNNFLNI